MEALSEHCTSHTLWQPSDQHAFSKTVLKWTDSMEQSSSEAKSSPASQEIPRAFEAQMFISVFTTDRQVFLSWVR